MGRELGLDGRGRAEGFCVECIEIFTHRPWGIVWIDGGRIPSILAAGTLLLDIGAASRDIALQCPAGRWIRLASTAKPLPPTRPRAMHWDTTRSKTRRKMSLSRNLPCRSFEKLE